MGESTVTKIETQVYWLWRIFISSAIIIVTVYFGTYIKLSGKADAAKEYSMCVEMSITKQLNEIKHLTNYQLSELKIDTSVQLAEIKTRILAMEGLLTEIKSDLKQINENKKKESSQ